jgi:uncharacterized protein (TIGR02588 family)
MGKTSNESPPTANDDDDGRATGRSAAEWTTFVISLVIVGGIVAIAAYAHLTRPDTSGVEVDVEVEESRASYRGGRYYIPYQVSNDGAAAAHDVTLVVEITRDGEVVEESTARIAFLPVGGASNGEIVTAFDPAQHHVAVRIGTLQSP